MVSRTNPISSPPHRVAFPAVEGEQSEPEEGHEQNGSRPAQPSDVGDQTHGEGQEEQRERGLLPFHVCGERAQSNGALLPAQDAVAVTGEVSDDAPHSSFIRRLLLDLCAHRWRVCPVGPGADSLAGSRSRNNSSARRSACYDTGYVISPRDGLEDQTARVIPSMGRQL